MKNIDTLIKEIVNINKAKKDDSNIWCAENVTIFEDNVSKTAWENTYGFSLDQLIKDRKEYGEEKLQDTVTAVESAYDFNSDTVYLEIGCGPSYVAEQLMKKYDCFFVGVDFNYKILKTLDEYFKTLGFTKYLLINADINKMPLNDFCIDFIYGGGVIEHTPNTKKVLSELYRVLKTGGVCYNTVPGFNLWGVLRLWNSIPDVNYLRELFSAIHLKLLKGKFLKRSSGYMLTFTTKRLKELHSSLGFKDIEVGPFAFHVAPKYSVPLLGKLFYLFTKTMPVSPMYFVHGKK
jgi:ubiquinone/menaquinone biosynthesis C-methylase UbiE